MTHHARRGSPATPAAGSTGRGPPPPAGPRHLRRRRRAAGHAPRLLRPQSPRPGPDRVHRRRRRRWPSRASTRCSSPRTSTRACTSSGTRSSARRRRRRHDRRSPTGEVRFVGDPVALVVAENRYVAEDACELVVVDYEPLPPVVDYLAAVDADVLVHEAYGSNVIHDDGAPCGDAGRRSFAAAAHVVEEPVHQQAYAAVPIETRGIVVEYRPRASTRSRCGSRPRRRTNIAPSAPGCSASRSTGSGPSLATPAVGSARRSSCSARRCASCSPRESCRRR